MAKTLSERPEISAGATDYVAIDGTDWLDATELFTGTPSVVEVTTTDLTLTGKAVNSAAQVIRRRTVAIGKAIQFTVAGQQAGTTYRVRVTAATDAGRTEVVDVMLVCV